MKRALVAGSIIALASLASCRGVIGIEEPPPPSEVDAGSPGSPAADAEPEAAAKVNSFCQKLSPQPQKCSDFETGDLRDGWDRTDENPDPSVHGGGRLEELFDDSGRKLLVSTPVLPVTGQKAGANLFFTLPVRPTRVLLQAEMKVITEEHTPDNETLLLQVVFGKEGAVVVYRDEIGAAVAVVPGGKAARFPSWPAGKPYRIGISVNNAPERGADGFAEASIDGVLSPELLVPAHFQKAGPPMVIVGLRTFAPAGAMKIAIDDIAIYWQ